MYKTEYDRRTKNWLAWLLDENKNIKNVGLGKTKEAALVDLGWNIGFRENCKISA